MPSEPLVLGFDTSAAQCAAALVSGDALLARAVEPMQKGQAERLVPLLEAVLAEAGRTWSDLDAVAVCTGPGNFTGIRIGVAAARGLALALDVPAIGITHFEALSEGDPCERPFVVCVGGRRYAQPLPAGAACGPVELAPDDPPGPDRSGNRPADTLVDPVLVASRAARLIAAGGVDRTSRPVPCYVRAPDAAPSAEPAPTLLDR